MTAPSPRRPNPTFYDKADSLPPVEEGVGDGGDHNKEGATQHFFRVTGHVFFPNTFHQSRNNSVTNITITGSN